MSQSLAVRDPVGRPAAAHEPVAALDPRRMLQLALGALWLLDGMLQFQPVMFGKDFPQMLAGSAPGNPALVARPISWSAAFIGHHVVVLNAIFAAIQLLLGLGIAWRPTVRLALAGSVLWSLAVWWLGEGLGGVLAGTATPVDGAPGAVVLYGLLAAIVLAAAFVIVALGTFLPRRPARAAIILAVVVAAVLWLAQGLGGILTGSATDPNTGPLLALLALAFWPLSVPARSAGETLSAGET